MNRIVVLALAGAVCLPAQTSRTPVDLDRAMTQVAAFEYGQNRDALHDVSDCIRASLKDPKALADVESRLTALLRSKATLAGKDFACRQLSLIGTKASVPTLAGMLGQTETANMALYALARIPGAAADDALRQALPKSSGASKVAVINALGHRRNPKSVPSLKGLVFAKDAAVAGAATAALGEIGDSTALEALAAARNKLSGSLQVRATEAYIRGAGKEAASGETGAALRIYKELLAPREPVAIRVAALSGIAKCAGGDAVPVLAEQLTSKEPRIQAAAVRFLHGIEGAEVTPILLAKLPALPPNGQVRVITALGERGDQSARPAIAEATNAGATEVRVAALAALGKVGDQTNLMLLAEAAAKRSGAEQAAARESLVILRGADTDAAILAGMSQASGAVRRELIRATGERAIPNSADTLLSITASEPEREVRREALRALRNVGRQEQTQALLDLVLKAASPADRSDAARTLATVMRRSDTPQIDLVVSAYDKAESTDARTAVLAIMGQASWDETLPVLRRALKDPQPEVCREAILALTEWTNPSPMADLLDLAKNSANPTHKVLALRGYLRLLTLQAPRSTQESVRLVSDAIPMAKAPGEKTTILSLLARYSSEESLVLAQKWLNDPSVATEAKHTVDGILTQLEFSRPLNPRK